MWSYQIDFHNFPIIIDNKFAFYIDGVVEIAADQDVYGSCFVGNLWIGDSKVKHDNPIFKLISEQLLWDEAIINNFWDEYNDR